MKFQRWKKGYLLSNAWRTLKRKIETLAWTDNPEPWLFSILHANYKVVKLLFGVVKKSPGMLLTPMKQSCLQWRCSKQDEKTGWNLWSWIARQHLQTGFCCFVFFCNWNPILKAEIFEDKLLSLFLNIFPKLFCLFLPTNMKQPEDHMTSTFLNL